MKHMVTEIRCKRFDTYKDICDSEYGPGAFWWGKHHRWEGDCLLIRLPDGIASLPVSQDKFVAANRDSHEYTVWHWDGDKNNPTLSPSVNSPPDGWHGWIKGGHLESV